MGSDSLKNDLMLFAILMVGLLVTMIVAGIVYIAADKLKETACETSVTTYSWNGNACINTTTNASGVANSDEVTIKAITQIGVVELAADVALGLLSLFIVILVFGVLLKITIKFAKGFSG